MNKGVIAFYLRLSDEDENRLQGESNSIKSQREILTEYVKGRAEFAGYQIVEFCDDGYSGTHFERPQVQRLLAGVRRGEISCIAVKDFSRFGRNYIEVGNYLEQVFPFFGVRFLSVHDCFDSDTAVFSGEFFDVAFKNLVYDLYSKDLSEKIKSVRRTKAEQGKFIGAYAPYGYLKAPEQRLVADPEAAPVVQSIFAMAIEGIPRAQIAKKLNENGIPSPLMLRELRGQHFPCNHVNGKCVWRTSAVSAILKDQRYAGDSVYGKVRPRAVGSRRQQTLPQEQWVIVQNTHEAVVPRETFQEVQRMFAKRAYTRGTECAPLAGKVRCAACGHAISRAKRARSNGIWTAEYRCALQDMTAEFGCYSGRIQESKIEEAVLTVLRCMSALVMNMELARAAEDANQEKIAQTEKLLIQYRNEVSGLRRKRLAKYEAYQRGIISREAFVAAKKEIDRNIEKILSDSEREQTKFCQIKSAGEQTAKARMRIETFAPFDALTRETAVAFVKQIFICEDGSLRIEWQFRDLFLALT